MTPRRRLLSVALAVLSLAGLAACSRTETIASGGDTAPNSSPAAAPDGASTGDNLPVEVLDADPADVAHITAFTTLTMIGDSITVASTPQLEARFAALGFSEPEIVAQSSKRIDMSASGNPSGTAVAEELVLQHEWSGDTDHPTELWIVALGTNDLNQYSEESEIAAAIDTLMAEVPLAATVIWVDTYTVGDPEASELLNQVIEERMAFRGDATVAHWSEVAGYDGVLRSDGIHPSETGTEVFAATVAAAVRDAMASA